MKKKIIFLLLSLSGLAFAEEGFFDKFEKPQSYSIRGYYDYSSLKGFVQIPKGGAKGSTSEKRPTFDELGIDYINFYEGDFTANWDKLSAYFRLRYMVFDGEATLKEELITHNNKIPAGSRMKTEHQYINFHFGAGYNISKIDKLKFSPVAEWVGSRFEYRYAAKDPNGNSISSRRKFGWGQVNVGFDSEYSITDNYKLELRGRYGIPYDNIKEDYSLSFVNNVNIFEWEKSKLNLLFGVEYRKFIFRDTQRNMQNYMKQESMIYKVGLEYSF
ncbi:hypothetical protein [Fusobacterium necrogenes]|uniref:hypothetical protein n=1 Tax=Fusobacterium necrogenes TaxID=858 RepID=UPI00255C6977|nr:hypothetical protein [Fusobacterium necrogenes]